MIRHLPLALTMTAALAGCAPRPAEPPPPLMPEFTSTPPRPQPEAPPADKQVQTTIVAGAPATPRPTARPPVPKGADIRLNFPAADIQVVAQGVLGDILHVPFTIAPGVRGPVTLVTPTPVPRISVFSLFEDALKAAGLAVTEQAGTFTIRTLEQARGQGVFSGGGGTGTVAGFASEGVTLQFVNAEEMKRLLDGILPGVVTSTDPAQNSLVLSGTTGQRTNARALLAQFDVNWLRNMSFALIVPQRTDARLIVPEVDKLINSPDAPTRGLVRLIAMERLNGILAITAQKQYLEDVRRWIEILDREGQNNERRLFVYHVQNGRSKDLAKVLNTAFGNITPGGSTGSDFGLDGAARNGTEGGFGQASSGQSGFGQGGLNNGGATARAADNGYAGARAIPPVPGGLPGSPTGLNGQPASQAPGGITASISSDEANNAIIVFGTAKDYAVIEDALRKLDVLPLQVLIEAAITEVTLNDALKYGVQWNFQTGQSNFALTDGKNTPASAPSQIFPGFSYFFSNNNSISATLNALETQTRINVLSAPKLMVLNNQTAALQVGDQVPIATQSAVSTINTGAPVVNSIEYRDTGVILKITPRVNAGGLVLLDIAQEVSDVSTTSTSNIDSPTISTRRISTSIAVQDGQVIALGGLIRDTRTKGKNGIPYLSRIPIVGGLLFGTTSDSDVRTELLVLLKPRVIRSPDDAQAVTDELRAKIKTVAPLTKGRMP